MQFFMTVTLQEALPESFLFLFFVFANQFLYCMTMQVAIN